jgi:hypothetical protein
MADERNVENFIKLIENIENDITNGIGAYWKNSGRFLESWLHDDYPLNPWLCSDTGGSPEDWGYTVEESEKSYLFHDLPEEEGGLPSRWASNYEYFFHLASEHEVVVDLHDKTTIPQTVRKVGARHRHWLDVNTIREEMDYDAAPDETSVAGSRNTAAKRIEFLLQLLKMHIMLENNAGNDIETMLYGPLAASDTDECQTSEAPATSNITNTLNSYYLPDCNPSITGFMAYSGYCNFNFTSPYRDGRQTDLSEDEWWALPEEGWIGKYPTSDMFDNHVYSAEFASPASSDMGPTAMGELYEEYGRYIYDDPSNMGAAPKLIHDGPVENFHIKYLVTDSDHSLTTVEPALFWEKWTCRANFESFLLYAAELIELLDVYYAAKDWGDDIAAGIKPNIFGGKAYMSYPTQDNLETNSALQKMGDNGAGYTFMSLSILSSMIDEISREDLLLSDEVRKWWEDFLSSYLNPASYDEDGNRIEEEEVPSNPPLSDDAPEDDFSLDIEVCIPEAIESPDECPDECVPNPNAFVLDWTLLDPGAVFFNEKTCEYCVVVSTQEANLYGIELTKYIEEGSQKLLDSFLKAEYIAAIEKEEVSESYWDDQTGKDWWDTLTGTWKKTIIGLEDDALSIRTMDVIFDSTSIQSFFGFLPEEEDFPKVPSGGLHIPEQQLLGCRVLVAIPARVFDKIPKDYASLTEREEPATGIKVNLLMSEFYDSNPFTNDMISDVTSAMRYYNTEYASWMHTADASDVEDFGTLNLDVEADKIKQFGKDIRACIKSHGYTISRLEMLEIGFNEGGEVVNGQELGPLEMIDYIKVNEPNCLPMLIEHEGDTLKNVLWNFTGDSWTDHRTLSYIQRLPDMWNDVRAREPMEWYEFITKYTADLKSVSALSEGMPDSAFECVLEDEAAGLDQVLQGTLDDIIESPFAFADKFNKALCSNTRFKYGDPQDKSALAKSAVDTALNNALKEFFSGDPILEMLPVMLGGFEDGPDGKTGIKGLWAAVFDKYGRCGILALIDMLLGCFLKGIPTADGLAILCESALRSLGPLEMERLLVGLTPEQQDAISAQVSESLGMVFATPPWENGYVAGSSSTGYYGDTTGTAYERAVAAGEEYSSAMATNEDGTINMDAGTDDGAWNLNYLSELDVEQYSATATYYSQLPPDQKSDWKDIMEDAAATHEVDLIFPDSAGAGTIGSAADEVQDAIISAYMDNILGGLSVDEQLSQLNALPGAEIYQDLLTGLDCAIPDIFNPPLGDYFKGLKNDYCRKGGFMLPKFKAGPDISWLDIRQKMMEALRDLITQLIITALIKLVTWLILMLLNSLCKLMAATTGLFAGSDFREAYRDSFCDSDISDEELDAAAATMFANLNGCDPEVLKLAATGFITDLSLILTASELVDLFNGEASTRALAAIVEIAQIRYPDSFGSCDGFKTTEAVSSTYRTLGMVIPAKYKRMPPMLDPEQPIHPSLCDEDALEEFDALRCELFSQNRTMTAEQCEEHLESLRERTREEIKQLADIKNSDTFGIELPPIISDDPCAASLYPAVDFLDAAAASDSSSAIASSLTQQHHRDLTANQRNQWNWGSGGLINMIMSSAKGQGFARHLDNIQGGDTSYFPNDVASYLKNQLADGDFVTPVKTTGELTEHKYLNWGVDRPRGFVIDPENEFIGEKDYIDPSVDDSKWRDQQRKKYDLKMEWKDWRPGSSEVEDDAGVDYEIQYCSYDLDYENGNKSILNDYFRIRIVETVKIGVPPFSLDYEVPKIGFEGEQRTEDEMTDLIDRVEADTGFNLDIEDELVLSKSPKNSLYARYVTEVIKSLGASNYSGTFDTFSGYCDDIFETYLKLFSARVADDSNGAWLHGFPSSYEEIWEEDENSLIPWMKPTGRFYSEDLESPSIIYLDETCKNLYTGEPAPQNPDSWGGIRDSEGNVIPAFYVPPPVFKGWGRVLQSFAPEEAACDPAAKGACDFGQLADFHDDIFDRIINDSRLGQGATCVVEEPWNKILPRSAAAGIEMSLKAVIRVYVSEWFVIGMPSFSVFNASMFDDVILDFIIDRIEEGVIEQPDGIGWWKNPNEFYFMFMEQVVQTFDRMLERGDITLEDLTPAEQEAITALNSFQETWLTDVAPMLQGAYYPGLGISAGMVAAASPFGPEAAGLAGILGSLTTRAGDELKRKYWTRFVAKEDNRANAKVLLRRMVREEMEFLAKNTEKDIKPPISDVHDLFFTNENMILGSISEAGPFDVASGNTLEHSGLEMPTSIEKIDGGVPYVLEKYIKVTDYLYDDAGLPSFSDQVVQNQALLTFESLTETQIELIKREDRPHLRGIVNLDDWEEYLDELNDAGLGGFQVNNLWSSWEFGLRVSQVTEDNVASWTDDELQKTNKAGPMTISYEVTSIDGTISTEIKDITLIPLVSTEKESPAIAISTTTSTEEVTDEVADEVENPKINDIAGNLKSAYDAELACLVSDLLEEPSYKLLFEYCISIPRILSVMTIYIMRTFLPSIGEDEDWASVDNSPEDALGLEKKGTPGGRKPYIGNSGFYSWNQAELFPRSKKSARAMFLGHYKSTDLNWSFPRFKLNIGWPSISLSLFWWLRSLQKHDVFDGDGNPC